MKFGSKKENMNRFTLLNNILKKNILFQNDGQNNFFILRNNAPPPLANKLENDGVDLNFFCVKRSVNNGEKRVNNGEKSGSESSKMREKQILGP